MDDRQLKRTLVDVYDRLYKRYGPQHWWPADEPFEVIIGAILTQSAAWTNVEKAISNLKKAGLISPPAILNTPEAALAHLIYPSGYYNVKARKLKTFTAWLESQYSGSLDKLFSHELIELRNRLLRVNGIGEETADSVILYAGGKPVFVIDAYTRRIVNRLGLMPIHHKYKDFQQLFMSVLPPDVQMFNEYHALLVKLAKDTCRKQPVCAECCLKPVCPGVTNKA